MIKKHKIKIVKNGVTLELKEVVAGHKSRYRGKLVPILKLNETTLNSGVKWLGKGLFFHLLNKSLRQVFIELYEKNFDEEADEFDFEQWKLDVDLLHGPTQFFERGIIE